MPVAEFDVAVLGGGPGGSTVARYLALRGHRVCLLHRVPQTGTSCGRLETLSPGALKLMRLHHPDVWSSIASLLVPCREAVLWTKSDEHSARGADSYGTLVNRHFLDSILLTSAASAGVTVWAIGPNIPSPSIAGEFPSWGLSSRQSEVPDIRSRFLVDAAGRSSAFRGTRFTLGPRTLALTAHVAGASLNPRSTCVEALAEGWLWAGHGNGADTAVTLFISPRTMHSWPRGEYSTRFMEMLRNTSLTTAMGNAPRMASGLLVRDATAAARPPFTAGGSLRVGDAALALDPLCGQGVQHALLSAVQAAIVLHTMLARQESSAFAQEFYRARHDEASHEHAFACRMFYQRQDRFNGKFWSERMSENSLPLPTETPSASPDSWIHDRLILSHETRWKEVPVIAGEFVESEPALCHPSLTRPIAYLEGQLAHAMLSDLSGEITGLVLLHRWASRARLPMESGLRALQFLVHHGIFLSIGSGDCRN